MTWRAIQGDLFENPAFILLPEFPRLLYLQILSITDAHGRIFGHPAIIAHRWGPTHRTPSEHADGLEMLHNSGLIDWYADPANDRDYWIQVIGFDDSQPLRLLERRGASRLPSRSHDHVDGMEQYKPDGRNSATTRRPIGPNDRPVGGDTDPSNRRQVAADPGIDPGTEEQQAADSNYSATTRRVLALRERERERERPGLDPSGDGLSLVSDAWRRLTKRSRDLDAGDRKRVRQVLRVFSAEDVIAYMEDALKDPWYWQRSAAGRSQLWRRDVVTIFPTKSDNRWDRRITNFLEARSGQDTSSPSMNYEPEDPARAAAALALTLGGAS